MNFNSTCSTSYYWNSCHDCGGCGGDGDISEKDIHCHDGIKAARSFANRYPDISVTKQFPEEGRSLTLAYNNVSQGAYREFLQCAIDSSNSNQLKQCEQVFGRLFINREEGWDAGVACDKKFIQCEFSRPIFPKIFKARDIQAFDAYKNCCETDPQHLEWKKCRDAVSSTPYKMKPTDQ
jgi:hypothetical protein